jgi:hypothetical protein
MTNREFSFFGESKRLRLEGRARMTASEGIRSAAVADAFHQRRSQRGANYV